MAEQTNKKIIKSLRKYLKKIEKKFHIERALLFGSRARGDYLLDSDVDLILVSGDFEEMDFRKRMAEALKYWKGDVDLEVICYTPKEFEKKSRQINIVRQALKEGIQIAP